MGDIVLSVPVIKSLLRKYPNVEITVLTRPFFQTFFENISQVRCFPTDLKGEHKGIFGLRNLVNEIVDHQKIDVVIDLHSVLRTWILDLFFKLKGISVYRIDKGRKEKKRFVAHKISSPLKHSTQRYLDVFAKAGFDFTLEKENFNFIEKREKHTTPVKIGIAPYAAHKNKMWGVPKIYELIETLNSERNDLRFYLFGGGKTEIETMGLMASYYNNVENVAGKLSLKDEIQKISEMDVFLSMDSGNMHIASLTGIPVVSVWGGTHPDVGFSALYQPVAHSVQLSQEQMPCRPCSVFGTSKCSNSKAFACMEDLKVEQVIQIIEKIIQ